jgi:D-alanyl-lipoteichoic acid acyltransferase DltB (MBOAT superfamily)
MIQRGFLLVGVGLFKKTVGDLLGQTADEVFATAGNDLSSLRAWTGALAFQGQIYGDFSGYTDIAIGISALLGFNLPPNFRLPFLATSPLDYWRRWHISLSTWIREYLYNPIALANRRYPYSNMIVTMAIVGLWHGARWNYVMFGLYHGILMTVVQWMSSNAPSRWDEIEDKKFIVPFQIAITFYLTLIGHVIFRSETMAQAWSIVHSLHHSSASSSWGSGAALTLLLVAAGVVVPHSVSYLAERRQEGEYHPLVLWPAIVLLFAFSMAFTEGSRSFIYFQF